MSMFTRVSRRPVAWAAAVSLTAVVALGSAAPAFASQPVDGSHKVAYCHATHSDKNPYVFIETDKIAVVKAHSKHQDLEDVYPGFWYDDHGTPTWMEGRADASFAENGCESGGIG
ncbi:MAG TPA: hypothetical protein VEP72_02850 [Microbacterium sp.]|nr:hypothetical protein [Microbacterium sp.]